MVKLRIRLLQLLLSVGICASMSLAIATAASAASTFKVAHHATTIADGAVLSLDVSMSCDPTASGAAPGYRSIDVALYEVAEDTVVEGFGSTSDFVCDGSPHVVTLFLAPQGPGSKPFAEGEALVMATADTCALPVPVPGSPECTHAEDVEIITVEVF